MHANRMTYDFFTPSDSAKPEAVLQRAGFTPELLNRMIIHAHTTLMRVHDTTLTSPEGASLLGIKPTAAEQKFIRKSGGVPAAVVAKLSANSITKRRPEDRTAFLAYVQHQYESQQPLEFRLGLGPVKNVKHYGANQTPDVAEFLMLTQLGHVMSAVATLHPHGVKVEMVPDDKRGADANQWPKEYGERYISGMQKLVQRMGFDSWLHIEDGQERLYKKYDVLGFRAAAEESLTRWATANPAAYAEKMERATGKALDNMVAHSHNQKNIQHEAHQSAWRYMIALKAEELSGIFAPRDVFPLRYAHHANSFQLYTMGEGQTKLPWQIALPLEAADTSAQAHAASFLLPRPQHDSPRHDNPHRPTAHQISRTMPFDCD